jgi:leucyl/phenylalanyl-tRNA--protein transferase
LPLPIYLLDSGLYFPPVDQASREGILAIGGDLSSERLIIAYKSGIFPWFNGAEPIIWWAPNPRMVLFLDELKVSKSMKKLIDKKVFKITFNKDFRAVIENCKKIERNGQWDTWISNEMIDAYCNLNQIGKAKSIEVWQNEELVGGLYGVDLGTVFCGESMFSKVSNASKIAFVYLVDYLKNNNYKLLDCQVHNDHLKSLGCREISRNDFMEILNSK